LKEGWTKCNNIENKNAIIREKAEALGGCDITTESPTQKCLDECQTGGYGQYTHAYCIDSTKFQAGLNALKNNNNKNADIKSTGKSAGCAKFFGPDYKCYCANKEAHNILSDNNEILQQFGDVWNCNELGSRICVLCGAQPTGIFGFSCPGYDKVEARYLTGIFDGNAICLSVLCCEWAENGETRNCVTLMGYKSSELANAVNACRQLKKEKCKTGSTHCPYTMCYASYEDAESILGYGGAFVTDYSVDEEGYKYPFDVNEGYNPCGLQIGKEAIFTDNAACPIYLFKHPGEEFERSDTIDKNQKVRIVGGPQWGKLSTGETVVWWLVQYGKCIAWYPAVTSEDNPTQDDCCLVTSG
ncbi:MAG: hypothetical protein DRP12_03110, partial [Candidatus Aenigmatarchaeota archaeon]